MHTLRNAHLITRLVLVWFALFLGVSIASPFVNAASDAPHCAAMQAMKVASANQGGSGGEKSMLKMDCPLCAGLCAPPASVSKTVAHAAPQCFVPCCPPATGAPLRTAAPPPGRGPPTFG